MTSLWNTYRNRFEILREAYNELRQYERQSFYDDVGGECCSGQETQDSHILLIALYVLILALAAFLIIATNTGTLGRRKREISHSDSNFLPRVDSGNLLHSM